MEDREVPMAAMNAAIDQIVQADQLARQNVTAARDDAAKIRADAQQQAKTLAAAQKGKLTEAIKDEVQSILAEAQTRTQQIRSETDAYVDRLCSCKEERLHELLTRLVKKVIGP
ncbi:MAG: V-type ATPase subunit subunit G family protein [Desulfobacteraceae bacterium]